MCGAIREFGFRIPVVAKSDGTVVDGHLRLKAARRLGLATVPVVLADELTDQQIKAFRLLANQSANWAEWDDELLRLELEELKEAEFDLDLTGFDPQEIEWLLAEGDESGTEGLTDEDEVPEPEEEPVTKPGDLWLLGEHRLLCGDATLSADVERALGGVLADMCITDFPSCWIRQKFFIGLRNSDSPFARPIAGMPSSMRQRSRAIEQSPSCSSDSEVDADPSTPGVFGLASSVKPGRKPVTGRSSRGAIAGSVRSRHFRLADEPMTGRPGQSRLMSFMESLANVLLGFLLALTTQSVVFPLVGIDTTFRTDVAISALFTALSIIRSFLLRRLFEALMAR